MKKRHFMTIYQAMKKGDIEDIKFFLPEHANDINDIGDTPIVIAVKYEDKELFNLLLDNGANLNVIENIFQKPLIEILWEYNRTYNWSDMLENAVKHGLNLNIKVLHNNPGERQGKELFINFLCRQSFRGIDRILSSKDNHDKKDLEFLKEMIRLGARIDIPDNYGKLPLEYLPKKIRKNIEAYMANREVERMGNIAIEIDNETDFEYFEYGV